MAADRKRKTVENLKKRIGEAKYNQVPEILLEGRGIILMLIFSYITLWKTKLRIINYEKILDLLSDQSNVDETKNLLWETGFMNLLSDALERDYLKVKNDWLTASKLSDCLTYNKTYITQIINYYQRNFFQGMLPVE